MRRDPIYLAYTITVPSEQVCQNVTASMRQQIAPDSELADPRVSSEVTETVHYRIGDFFEDIALFPDAEETNQFRVVFHRQPNAGRFWKDIMVRIVRGLETDWGASVSLAYQGDVPLEWMRSLTVR